MGTPEDGDSSSLIDNSPPCLLCHAPFVTESKCPDHTLCIDCTDSFCPFCLKQLNPITINQHSVDATHGDVFWNTADLDIKIVFIYGFIEDIVVLRSSVNCRLQCTWATSVFDIHVYRGRSPYSGIFTTLPKCRGKTLDLVIIPPNPHGPKMKGGVCSMRIFLEMFLLVLDRPEARKLHLLPNTVEDFIKQYTLNPQQKKQVWQYESDFFKYGCLFFTTDVQTNAIGCLQCGAEYTSLETLHQQCLGGFYIDCRDKLYSAKPVNIHFSNGVVQKTIAQTPYSTYKMFVSMPHYSPFQKKRPFQPSCLCRINIDISITPVVPESAIKYVQKLLSAEAIRVQKFFVYDLKSQEGLLSQINVWFCDSIYSCRGISHVCNLNIFESCMHLSLYSQIVKYGQVLKTAWGTIHYWQDFHAGKW